MSHHPKKKHLTIVIAGNLNSGKSTLAGHLIFRCGGVDERTVARCEEHATVIGHSGTCRSRYAYITDNLTAERENGMSVDISIWSLESPNYQLTMIDTPGHPEFVEKTIGGIAQSHVIVMVIDCVQHRLGVDMSEHGRSQEYALLAYSFGVRQIIVAINKMDDPSVDYSENLFTEVRNEMSDYIRSLGYDDSKVCFIPTSGWEGDSLTDRSTKMPWYEGPFLLEALNNVDQPLCHQQRPLRIPIQDVFEISGTGSVAVGRVESGTLETGRTVALAPSGILAEVKSIEMHHQATFQAIPGHHVGFNIDVDTSKVRRGCVASDPTSTPACRVTSFESEVLILCVNSKIRSGFVSIIYCHQARVPCHWKQLKAIIDRRTGAVLSNDPEHVKNGDLCVVKFEPKEDLSLETFSDFPALGRIVIRDTTHTIAAGIVTKVTKAA